MKSKDLWPWVAGAGALGLAYWATKSSTSPATGVELTETDVENLQTALLQAQEDQAMSGLTPDPQNEVVENDTLSDEPPPSEADYNAKLDEEGDHYAIPSNTVDEGMSPVPVGGDYIAASNTTGTLTPVASGSETEDPSVIAKVVTDSTNNYRHHVHGGRRRGVRVIRVPIPVMMRVQSPIRQPRTVDELLQTCPSNAEIDQIRNDFSISFDHIPQAWSCSFRGRESSETLTIYNIFRVLKFLRVYSSTYGNVSLYDMVKEKSLQFDISNTSRCNNGANRKVTLRTASLDTPDQRVFYDPNTTHGLMNTIADLMNLIWQATHPMPEGGDGYAQRVQAYRENADRQKRAFYWLIANATFNQTSTAEKAVARIFAQQRRPLTAA